MKISSSLIAMLLIVTSCTAEPLHPVAEAAKSAVTERKPADDWDAKYVVDQSSVKTEEGVMSFTLNALVQKLNDGWREELTNRSHILPGQSVQFNIWTSLPEAALHGAPESTTISQWHEQLAVGFKRPPYAMRLRGNEFIITIWNDRVYDEQGQQGDGLMLLKFPAEPGAWYHIQGCLTFDPTAGDVRIQVRKCESRDSCPEAATYSYVGAPGLGYIKALSYYFKFGVYTTLPFTSSLTIQHAVGSTTVEPVPACHR